MVPGQLPAATFPMPLKRVSPSRFVGLQGCVLREVWTANRIPAPLPVSARARLGTVVHRLLERVGKNAVPVALVTSELWDEELRKVEREMEGSWLERNLVPLHTTVPDAEVHRLRALDRARKLTARLPVRDATRHTEGLGFEVWVQSSDGTVGGFIDSVFKDDGLVIRDYKSGAIYETDEGGSSIRSEYVVQIRMYAALYSETFGVWPERLEIVPVRGDEAQISVDKHQCLQLVERAKECLTAVNAEIAASHASGAMDDLSRLATPSAETCTACSFRPQCNAYLTVNAGQQDKWPLDILGTVSRIQRLGNGSVSLGLIDLRGNARSVRGLTAGERHPALKEIEPGSHVGIFSLQRTYPVKDLSETLYTTVYLLPPALYAGLQNRIEP